MLKNTTLTLGEISQKYNNISKSTISMINQGKIWKENDTNYPIRPTDYGSKGEKNPRAKFTEQQVIEIRKKYSQGAKPKDLKEEYKFYASSSAVDAIIYGKSYKHLPIWDNKTKSWK